MDINQNQQTNTFLKGMNTDTSDMLLGSDQYRYAENVRIVTDTDSNSGELRIIEGNSQIPVLYDDDKLLYGTVLAANYIRDIAVVILKEEPSSLWSIYKMRRNGDAFKAVRIFGPCEDKITVDGKSIDTVLRWESDNNIKLYICSGMEDSPLWVLKFDNDFKSEPKNIPVSIDYFKQSSIFIPSPLVEISDVAGEIKGPVVQYSYRLYSENGVSTNISPLSIPLSLYVSYTKGSKLDKQSNKAVQITVPNLNTNGLDKIQIYRVSYQLLGMQPVIDKIVDGDYSGGEYTFVDYGYSITNLATSEYNTLAKTIVFPKSIESKGDYLFYANISYAEDSVNKQIEDLDVRCFSKGSYITDETGDKFLFDNGYLSGQLEITADTEVKNAAFQNNGQQNTYDTYWGEVAEGINGYGKYFSWRYVQDTVTLSIQNQTGSVKNSYRTYRRGEVYRFGVRLFNKEGYASSVKWLCDIQIPNNISTIVLDSDNETIQAKPVSIEFIPHDLPDYISGYEIVQCVRTTDDKYTVSLGLVGALTTTTSREAKDYYKANGETSYTEDSYILFNGFVSLDDIYARTHLIGKYVQGGAPPVTKYANEMAYPYDKAVMFASPEYCYLSDDIRDIIDTYTLDTFKLKYRTAYQPYSSIGPGPGEELRIYQDDYSEYEPNFYKTNFVTSSTVGDIPAYSLGYKSLRDTNIPLSKEDLDETFSTTLKRELRGYFYDLTVGVFNNGVVDISQQYDNDDLINGINLYLAGNSALSPVGFQTALRSAGDRWYTRGIRKADKDKTDGLDLLLYTNEGDVSSGTHFLNLFHPMKEIQDPFDRRGWDVKKDLSTIDDVEYISSADPTKFSENDITSITNSTASVQNKQFVNWSELFFPQYKLDDKTDDVVFRRADRINLSINNNTDDQEHIISENAAYYPVSAGGKYMIFFTSQDGGVPNNAASDARNSAPPTIYVYDLVKTALPYGGYTKNAIENSRYISVGAAQTKNEPIKVSGGDSFIKMFVYNAGHDWYSAGVYNAVHMASIYAVPIETDIDLQGLYSDALFIGKNLKGSDTINRANKSYYIQDEPFAALGYIQEDASYMYNTAYNVLPNAATYYQDRSTKGNTNNFDTRVHYSDRKINNEAIDSWSSTKPMNFIDVDSRYGLITDLKLFKDKLVYWQENATGILSVNERLLINTEDDIRLQLGYGGVLERFDYISTIYGMKNNQRSCAESNTTLYWWDDTQRALLAYGESLTPLSELKGVKNYINKNKSVQGTPTLVYDNKYKELISHVVGNESVIYSEIIQQFVSVYSYCPQFNFDLSGQLYTMPDQISLLSEENKNKDNKAKLYDNIITPAIEYVVNNQPTYNKTFDIQTFGGRFYGGDDLSDINFIYKTPLKLEARLNGGETNYTGITNREYDFRLNVPRAGYETKNEKGETVWKTKDYGDRLRGKTMHCRIESSSNDLDFALQYVTTKFRMSWV